MKDGGEKRERYADVQCGRVSTSLRSRRRLASYMFDVSEKCLQVGLRNKKKFTYLLLGSCVEGKGAMSTSISGGAERRSAICWLIRSMAILGKGSVKP